MRQLWFRFLVFWYRLTGMTSVQAEWRARQTLAAPATVSAEAKATVARAADARFTCVCGQLLVRGDAKCHVCNRRQYLPFAVRRAGRLLRGLLPGESPGTLLAGALMVLGYLAQWRHGDGQPTDSLVLFELGMSWPPLTMGPQPWRAVTYTMLHGGFMHILFNGILLVQIGPLVERTVGSGRFLFCWVMAGVAGAMIPPLLGSLNPVIGASGSGFGLMGMAALLGHRARTAQGRMIREVMIRWAIYSTVFGLMMGNVAHSAHFAGMGTGALLAALLPPPVTASRRRLTPWIGAAGLAVLVAGLFGFAQFFSGGARFPPLPRGAETELVLMQVERRGVDAVLPEGARAAQVALRAAIRAGDGPAALDPWAAALVDATPSERWVALIDAAEAADAATAVALDALATGWFNDGRLGSSVRAARALQQALKRALGKRKHGSAGDGRQPPPLEPSPLE